MSAMGKNYIDLLHKGAAMQARSGMLYGDFLLNDDQWTKQESQLACLRRAAVALILFNHESDGPSLLLSQRAKGLRHHAGQVGFPGGQKEESDKGFLFTAVREAQEEISLNLCPEQLLSPMAAYASNSGFLIKPFLFYVPDLKPQNQMVEVSEVDSLFSVPLHKLFDPSFCQLGSFDLGSGIRFFARFDTKPGTLWGVSAGIVAFLLMDSKVELTLEAPNRGLPKRIDELQGVNDLQAAGSLQKELAL